MLVAMRGHFQSWGSRARGALEEGTGAESLQERRLFHQVPLPWSPATSSLLGHRHQAEQGFLGTQGSGEATSRVPHAHFPGIHSGVTLSSSSPACHMLTQTVGPEQPPPPVHPPRVPFWFGKHMFSHVLACPGGSLLASNPGLDVVPAIFRHGGRETPRGEAHPHGAFAQRPGGTTPAPPGNLAKSITC